MGVGEQEDEAHQAIQIAVIVPRAFVEQENVPIRQDEDKARRLELISERNSQGSCKSSYEEERVNRVKSSGIQRLK